jgi:hypothetical protein
VKRGSNNTLECFGRWENCTVEGTPFEGGSFEYETLEISLFVVERTLFRNQLSVTNCDGVVDKGIAFL